MSGIFELKKLLSITLLGLMLSISLNTHAASADSEMQGETLFIESIDFKKKIVSLDDVVFSFSSATVVYDQRGVKTTVDALTPGAMIKIKFSSRSSIRPMLTEVKILSVSN